MQLIVCQAEKKLSDGDAHLVHFFVHNTFYRIRDAILTCAQKLTSQLHTARNQQQLKSGKEKN